MTGSSRSRPCQAGSTDDQNTTEWIHAARITILSLQGDSHRRSGMNARIPIRRFREFARGLDHPEGLAFDADGKLWAGGEQGQIYCMDRRGKVKEVACLGGFCLGLTFSTRQELVVCNLALHSVIFLNRKGRVLRTLERVGNRKLVTPNFSVFDSQGNLYFSDSGHWRGDNSWIYRITKDHRAELWAGPFAFANGLALSLDEKTLFVVQTQRDDVLAIPVLPNAQAGKPRIYASGLATIPDGAALDDGGNLYVTTYSSHKIYRIEPNGTVSLFAFDPEATMLAGPTNIAFGGPDLNEMYVANLNRWHICRTRAGIKGQRLVNLR
jgi:gluconolactonase